MLIATSAVLLKNRDGLGGPDDMVGFVGHASPRFSVCHTRDYALRRRSAAHDGRQIAIVYAIMDEGGLKVHRAKTG